MVLVDSMTQILVAQVEEIKQDPRVLAEYPHRTIYHEFMKDASSRLPDKVRRPYPASQARRAEARGTGDGTPNRPAKPPWLLLRQPR